MQFITNIVASAGGGGSDGGGAAAGILMLPLIVFGAIASWLIRRKRIKKAETRQRQAQARDATWSDDVIEHRVTDVFYSFQKDWSEFNAENMKSYLTPQYHYHISLILGALQQMNRRNDMKNVSLDKLTLFAVDDSENDERDRFDVEVSASVTDNLVDVSSGKVLHKNPSWLEALLLVRGDAAHRTATRGLCRYGHGLRSRSSLGRQTSQTGPGLPVVGHATGSCS
jgi:hypothetical protein